MSSHSRKNVFADTHSRARAAGQNAARREVSLRLVDWVALGYVALVGFALPVFHQEVPDWARDFCVHVLFFLGALTVIYFGETHTTNWIWRFLRTFYPLAIIFYGYFEMNHMNRMFCGSYWAMNSLMTADQAIFGVHPTVWVQQLYSPGRDEVMSLFYVSYYAFAPLATLPLFLRGRQEETFAVFGIATIAYVGNFILFYAFPSLCPRMIPELEALRTTDYTGYYAAALVKHFQAQGAISGGCFPSTHVSGAMAWALAAWRYQHRLGYFLLPLACGVACATVYLGYHHALDPLVGIMWAFGAYALAVTWLRRRGEEPLQQEAATRPS